MIEYKVQRVSRAATWSYNADSSISAIALFSTSMHLKPNNSSRPTIYAQDICTL